MDREKKSHKISSYFEQTDENFTYEIAFRRWLIFEIETKKMSIKAATELFEVSDRVIRYWRDKYSVQMVLPLEDMTAEERQKMELLQKQLKEAEKKLAQASIENIALNTLIDVAEEKLKINIRKKSGAKQ